jgi:hypothetical protein
VGGSSGGLNEAPGPASPTIASKNAGRRETGQAQLLPLHRGAGYVPAMATSKMSPSAALKVTELESYSPRVGRLNSLVEQFAADKVNPDNWSHQIKRTAGDLRLKLMTAGFESLSQICGTMVMTLSRSGNHGVKTRALREQVGNLKFQLENAIRTVVREDELERRKEEAKETKEG